MQVDFLDVLRKLATQQNWQVTLVRPPFDELEHFDYGLRKALDPAFDWQALGRRVLAIVQGNTLFLARICLSCTSPRSGCPTSRIRSA